MVASAQKMKNTLLPRGPTISVLMTLSVLSGALALPLSLGPLLRAEVRNTVSLVTQHQLSTRLRGGTLLVLFPLSVLQQKQGA